MKELIGFNLVTFAISMLLIWLIGWSLSTKDKLILIMAEAIFLEILSVGTYLLANG